MTAAEEVAGEPVTHATLAEALVAAQAAMPAVDKDSVNPHFKSKFTSLDHLIAKTRPVLNRHGLSLTQWPTYTTIDGELIHALRTEISHGGSGEVRSAVMPLIVGKNDMQGLGSALTYAKRYAWAAALGISTDEDDDGNQASRPEVTQTARASTGARRSATQPQDEPLATPEQVEAYRLSVLEAELDWDHARKAMSDPPTANEIERESAALAKFVTARQLELANDASDVPF